MSNDDNIEVKISANSAELKAGLNDGAAKVDTSTKEMADAFGRMEAAVSKSTTVMSQSMADVNRSINQSMGSVADAFKKVQGALLAVTAVAAGGAAFRSIIGATTDWAGQAGMLSKQLGITTEQASVLNVALNHLGLSSEQYSSAAFGMSKQITTNAAAFAKMGVQVKDATGDYRPITDVMSEVNTKLAAITNTTERNIDGTKTYGKQWRDLQGILKLNADQMAAAEKRARDLGLIVGPDGEAKAKQYKTQMRDLSLVGKSLEIQFGNVLIPIFTSVGAWMANEGPKMAKLFGDALKLVAEAGIKLYYTLQGLGTVIAGVMAAAGAALTGNFTGAKEVIKSMIADVDKLGEEANKALTKLFAPPPPIEPEPRKKGKRYNLGDKDGAEAQDPGRTAQWEADLAKLKDNYAKAMDGIGSMGQVSLQNEVDYWGAILDKADLTNNERIAAEKKYYSLREQLRKDELETELEKLNTEKEAAGKNFDERVTIAKKAYDKIAEAYGEDSKQAAKANAEILKEEKAKADQITRINQSIAETKQKLDAANIDSAERVAMIEADSAGASAAQKLEIERRFLEQRRQLELADLQMRIDATKQKDSPEEYQKLLNQKLQMEQQYSNKSAELRAKSQAEAMAPLKGILDATQQSLAKSMEDMLSHTKNLQQGLQQVWQSIGSSIRSELAKMASDQVMAFAKERMLSVANIGAKSAEAGAGAAASQASIPIVGPALALAAMGATMAAVGALASKVPHASKGFDIPAGVNPLTQLHESEMVLPKEQADVIRSMASGGGGGGGHTFQISAVDARSFESFLLHRGGAEVMVKALASAARNG